jgi:hypothetical protein
MKTVIDKATNTTLKPIIISLPESEDMLRFEHVFNEAIVNQAFNLLHATSEGREAESVIYNSNAGKRITDQYDELIVGFVKHYRASTVIVQETPHDNPTDIIKNSTFLKRMNGVIMIVDNFINIGIQAGDIFDAENEVTLLKEVFVDIGKIDL